MFARASTLSILAISFICSIRACRLSQNVIQCDGFRNFHLLNDSLHLVLFNQVNYDRSNLYSLKIRNSTIDIIPEYGFGRYRFEKIYFENVALRKIHRLAFVFQESIKYFILRNSDSNLKCLQLNKQNDRYDIWSLLRSMKNLKMLELCVNNRNDLIPKKALKGHNRLMTIRFNGDYSLLKIEDKAFDQMNRIRLIVFNQLNITKIGGSDFRSTSQFLRTKQSKVTIIFNRCLFGSFDKTFQTTFTNHGTRFVDWYLNSGKKNLIKNLLLKMI